MALSLKLNPPQDYTVVLSETGSGALEYALSSDGDRCTFSAPASRSKTPKVYTLSAKGALLYVGFASQGMAGRLRLGFQADGAGGYHGYKWKMLRDPLLLSVWTATSGKSPVSRVDMETVEAEVAFLCRLRSGQWPAHQTEIHFFKSSAAHRAAAEKVYAHAIGRTTRRTRRSRAASRAAAP